MNIPLIDTDSGANNNIVNWDWNFGNGNTSNLANASATYTASGTYTVTLTTTNANGCRATATTNVIISPLPVAGFTAGTACLNTAVQFNNTSTINGGTITGYSSELAIIVRLHFTGSFLCVFASRDVSDS